MAAALATLLDSDGSDTKAPAHKKAEAPSPSGERFIVQVASFPVRASAERLVAQLSSSGHGATIEPVTLTRGTVYRVVLGGFSSRSAAEDAKARVATSHGLPGLVRVR